MYIYNLYKIFGEPLNYNFTVLHGEKRHKCTEKHVFPLISWDSYPKKIFRGTP